MPPPTAPDLAGLRFGVAGPGRVGRSLARWATQSGAELRLVVRRRSVAGSTGADSFDAPAVAFDEVGRLARRLPEPLDVLFLTVSDAALAPVARAWRATLRRGEAPGPPPFRVVLHAAGAHDAEVLAPLRDACDPPMAVGSLHPLRAFSGVVPQPGPDPFFAVDGDRAALRLARRLVAAWHGTCCELSGPRRVAYHLAASLAAGGVVTVLSLVAEILERADLPAEVLAGDLGLLRGAVEAAERAARREGPGAVPDTITGPAARGDAETLARHRAALEELAPELLPTVETLWRETRRQVARRPRDESPRDESGEASSAETPSSEDQRDLLPDGS